MGTPVNTNITVLQGDFEVEVRIEATSAGSSSRMAAVQLERAAQAMAVLLGNTRPSNDDDDEEDA